MPTHGGCTVPQPGTQSIKQRFLRLRSLSGTGTRQVGRVRKTPFEIARAMTDRADAVRKIADRLTDNTYRSFLQAVAKDCEGQAKSAADRARWALKREHHALVEKSQDCERGP